MLLDPQLIVTQARDADWMRQIPQTDYIPILARIASSALHVLDRDLVSLAAFGSIAGGDAHRCSDIDILLISRNLPSSYSQRAVLLAGLVRRTSQLRHRLWRDMRIHPDIDLLALTPEEARVNQPIYLDMIDRDDFLAWRLKELRNRLESMGSRRIRTPGGILFWSLKPEVKPGEVVEI